MITVDEFIRQRKSDWDVLAEMTRRVQRQGFRVLTPQELESYSRLYRKTAGDLARVQTRYRNHDLLSYLNQLVGQAHGQIYVAPVFGPRQILRFYIFGFPKAVRDNLRPILLSTLVSLLAASVAFAAVRIDSSYASAVVPMQFIQGLEDHIKSTGGDVGPGAFPIGLGEVLASFIMINNIKVGFIAFASGVLWGVPTIAVLVQNGLMIGGMSALFQKYHAGLSFWSLILPHGILELTAIFICGGAGLMMGQAMIAPGDYLRKDALVMAGQRAVRLIVGCVPLFVIAAVIESYITPPPLDRFLKLGFALLTAAGMIAYLSLREPETK